jgi:predicted RNase H-like nuclease (RuvC/YqgF family)
MELTLCLIALLAVNELKEWRSERRHRRILAMTKATAARIASLAESFTKLKAANELLAEDFNQAKAFIIEADAKLTQMQRDYELKIRSNEMHSDYVEGL